MAKLSDKQARFVEEYLIDLNATQAAIRAGYSTKYADRKGHELIENNRVSEEISKAMAERSRRTGVNQDRIIQELAKMAFVNIDDIFDFEKGKIKPDASKEDLACIESIKIKKTDTGDEIQVKMASKTRSVELLGKHLGLFRDKLEISGMNEEVSKLDELIEQLGQHSVSGKKK